MLPPKLADVNGQHHTWLDNLLRGMLDFIGLNVLCWMTTELNVVGTSGIEVWAGGLEIARFLVEPKISWPERWPRKYWMLLDNIGLV